MTILEESEFQILSDKRISGTLTDTDYKRYLVLLDKVFAEGFPKITKSWMEGFGL